MLETTSARADDPAGAETAEYLSADGRPDEKTKISDPSHPDIQQLESALDKIKKVLTHINKSKRLSEEKTKTDNFPTVLLHFD